MLEITITAHRGSFSVQIDCQLIAPWTVVFGPSGAGKSTLLRLIAGLERLDAGYISHHARGLADTATRTHLKPGQRSVGMVTQGAALFPHLRVGANVAYGLDRVPQEVRAGRVASMLELVGAVDMADRWPSSLSGGEAQRVALARALAPHPRLLLLDEPLSALDAAARDQVLGRLQGWLAQQEIQTMLVTHDAADAMATGAEVLVLQEGRLVAMGPANTVLAMERERLLSRLRQS